MFSNFNNLSNMDNPLMRSLQQYFPQQEPSAATPREPQNQLGGAGGLYEVNSREDIEYIKPDTSGRLQIFPCLSENKIYTGRYSYERERRDLKAYIYEGEVNLYKKDDNGDMGKLVELLNLLVGKLDAMHTEIQEIKESPYPINKHKKTALKGIVE